QGLTWNLINNGVFNGTNRQWIGWAQAPASPALTSLAGDWGAAIAAGSGVLLEIASGFDPAVPIVPGSTIAATGTSTTPSAGTAPALADPGNLQLLCESSRANSGSPEASSSWTEIADVGVAASQIQAGAYYLGTPGDTSPTSVISSN